MKPASSLSARRPVRLAILVLAGVLFSCTSVKSGDLLGDWTMTEQSRKWLPAEIRDVSPRFTLNSDGSFTAVDLPEFHLHLDGDARTGKMTWINSARSGRGTWRILTLDGGLTATQ